MIRLVDWGDPRLALGLGEPLLTAVIQGNARVCGGGIRRDFWLVLDGEEPVGALCRRGNSFWATVAREEEAPEAARFLLQCGYARVETDPLVAALLPGPRARYAVMEYAGERPGEQALCPPSVMAVVDCNIAAGALPAEAREDLYAELHLRVRRGAAQVFLAPGADGDGDRWAAASALSFIGESRAVVGYVAALPQERGRGCATVALRAAVRGAMDLGKTPVLACAGPLAPFYEARGFRAVGELWEIPAQGTKKETEEE